MTRSKLVRQARLVGVRSTMDLSGVGTYRAAKKLTPRAPKASIAGAVSKTNASARAALKG